MQFEGGGARLLCKSTSDASKSAAARVDQAAITAERVETRYWDLAGKLAHEEPARIENGDVKAFAAVAVTLPWVSSTAEANDATHVLLLPMGMALFAEIGLIVRPSILTRSGRSSGERCVADFLRQPAEAAQRPAHRTLALFPPSRAINNAL